MTTLDTTDADRQPGAPSAPELDAAAVSDAALVGSLMFVVDQARDLLDVADFLLWSFFTERDGESNPGWIARLDALPRPKTLDDAVRVLIETGAITERDAEQSGVASGSIAYMRRARELALG